MRLKALLIAVTVVFAATGSALAVGYERYVINGPSQRATDNRAESHASLEKALRQASLCESYPKVLDEVAFTVKDILSQFGLVNRQSP
jgi:hypothetical protein